MAQKIRFYYDDPKALLYTNPPVPASKHLPSWFKESANVPDEQNPSLLSVKKCMALVDVFSFGYIFELACDLQISQNNEGYEFRWDGPFQPIMGRNGKQVATFPILSGHSPLHYAWICPYGFQTPKNWSVLVTHPHNHYELPFVTLSGIIDSDGYGASGIYPFSIKEGYEGVIQKGTPLFQIQPFKRDSWASETIIDSEINRSNEVKDARSVTEGWYRKNFWDSKQYR
jgi:hypothetical protein